MITIKDKKNCCGCSACVQRCPKHCISMQEDKEGFLYPIVDKDNCVNCGICEKVCPVINQAIKHLPLEVFAAKNTDETIRIHSSSGGVFTLLAEYVIGQGGVVFGACFNNKWELVHDYAESKEDILKFCGSKYLQSKIGESYKKAEVFLKSGRMVLFSGTPCQVAGLKKFLRKDYANLVAIDFICHGVPSPGVFRSYLRDELMKESARQGGEKNMFLLSFSPRLQPPERKIWFHSRIRL